MKNESDIHTFNINTKYRARWNDTKENIQETKQKFPCIVAMFIVCLI